MRNLYTVLSISLNHPDTPPINRRLRESESTCILLIYKINELPWNDLTSERIACRSSQR